MHWRERERERERERAVGERERDWGVNKPFLSAISQSLYDERERERDGCLLDQFGRHGLLFLFLFPFLLSLCLSSLSDNHS